MGALKSPKNQALLARESKNSIAKGRKKGKDKKNTESNPKEKPNPLEGSSSSKKDKKEKGEKSKCTYCKNRFHTNSSCMKETIDQMTKIIKNNDISLPEGARKNDTGINSNDRERCHAQKDGFSKYQAFFIDSRASKYMIASK